LGSFFQDALGEHVRPDWVRFFKSLLERYLYLHAEFRMQNPEDGMKVDTHSCFEPPGTPAFCLLIAISCLLCTPHYNMDFSAQTGSWKKVRFADGRVRLADGKVR
jgi:hypothetical protein